MKKPALLLICCLISILYAGCSMNNVTPARDLSEDPSAWTIQINNCFLSNESITDQESINRVVYVNDKEVIKNSVFDNFYIVGYLSDSSPTVIIVRKLCEDFTKAYFNCEYSKTDGKEGWQFFTETLQSRIDPDVKAKILKDHHVIQKCKGIKRYNDILIKADGSEIIVNIKLEIDITADKEYLDIIEYRSGKNEVNYIYKLRLIDGHWLIDNFSEETWNHQLINKRVN